MGLFDSISDSISKLLLDQIEDVTMKPLSKLEGRNVVVHFFEGTATLRKRGAGSGGKIEVHEDAIVGTDYRGELQISEISDMYGIPQKVLRKLCRDKLVKAKKRRGRWFIDLESLERYLKKRPEGK